MSRKTWHRKTEQCTELSGRWTWVTQALGEHHNQSPSFSHSFHQNHNTKHSVTLFFSCSRTTYYFPLEWRVEEKLPGKQLSPRGSAEPPGSCLLPPHPPMAQPQQLSPSWQSSGPAPPADPWLFCKCSKAVCFNTKIKFVPPKWTQVLFWFGRGKRIKPKIRSYIQLATTCNYSPMFQREKNESWFLAFTAWPRCFPCFTLVVL